MSLFHAGAPYRRDHREQRRVPVVLPLVQVSIDEHGMLDVVLDREPYDAEGPLVRADLRRVLDAITSDLRCPVRVEIREPDGSVFTDIATPDPEQDQPSPSSTVRPADIRAPNEIAGDGFLADEQVAVAVVVTHHVADQDGTARLRLPPALLADLPGVVVLLGRTSGAVAVSGGAA